MIGLGVLGREGFGFVLIWMRGVVNVLVLFNCFYYMGVYGVFGISFVIGRC